jgi:hypothetical protein
MTTASALARKFIAAIPGETPEVEVADVPVQELDLLEAEVHPARFQKSPMPLLFSLLFAPALPGPDPFHDLGAVDDPDMFVVAHAPEVLGESAGEGLGVSDLVVRALLGFLGDQRVHLLGFFGENVEFFEKTADFFDHLGPHLGIKFQRLVRVLPFLGGRGEGREGEKEDEKNGDKDRDRFLEINHAEPPRLIHSVYIYVRSYIYVPKKYSLL